MRRVLIVAVAAAVFAVLGATAVFTPAPQAAGFQGDGEGEEDGAAPPVVERTLILGETYSGTSYIFTPHAIRITESDLPGYDEVRIGVHLRNDGPTPITLDDYGLPDGDGRVSVFIETGTESEPLSWGLNLLQPLRGARAGSELTAIEPGLAARWTLGFQVLSGTVTDGRLVLAIDGARVASWDLGSTSVSVEYDAPAFQTVEIDTKFNWDEDVRVTAKRFGSLVCGDPSIEPVAHIVTVVFEVENDRAEAYVWPGTRFPVVPAVAQWADGSSARTSLETFVGDEETFFRYLGGAGTLLPPKQTVERALVMAAPRDGRFVDLSTLPLGLWMDTPLNTDAGIWLDLDGTAASIGLDPALCDLGTFPAPVAYAYGPSPKFEFFGEGAFPDPAAQDAAAEALLRSALAAAGRWFNENGFNYDAVTTDALDAFAPSIRWQAHTAGSALGDGVGVVFYDRRAGKRNDFYVITQSASGKWFCSLQTAYESTNRFVDLDPVEAAGLCVPELAGADDEES